MADTPYNFQSPSSRRGDESEDWPTDEPISARCFQKLQIFFGMQQASLFPSFSPTPMAEWPSDDELEERFLGTRSSPSTQTLDREMSASGSDETGTTSPEGSQGAVIDLTIDNVVVDLSMNDVIDLKDEMEIDEPFDTELQPGMSVELRDGSYLRIESVDWNDGEQFLRGRRLLMTTDDRVKAYVPKVPGELIWVITVEGHVPLEYVTVSVAQVTRIEEIRFTNARSDWQPQSGLWCRLKLTVSERISTTSRRSERAKEPEHSIEYLSLEETDEDCGWTSAELRNDWRGHTTPFGEAEHRHAPSSTRTAGQMVIDLTDAPPVDRTYTFGDAFCGAGGTSCGARQAGLSVLWGSDKDKHAVETYSLNFDADVYHACFDQLMGIPAFELRAEIIHCSPPCQPFSPAHTVNNQANDEQNSACIFAAGNLLQKTRPRILTMEETAGLQERHIETLQRVILDIVEAGCSVRWSVLDCFHYGVPQCRKRLVVIAAG